MVLCPSVLNGGAVGLAISEPAVRRRHLDGNYCSASLVPRNWETTAKSGQPALGNLFK
jgi:hypothetical protein